MLTSQVKTFFCLLYIKKNNCVDWWALCKACIWLFNPINSDFAVENHFFLLHLVSGLERAIFMHVCTYFNAFLIKNTQINILIILMKGKVIITFLPHGLQMFLFEMWVIQYFIRLNDIIGIHSNFEGVIITPLVGLI